MALAPPPSGVAVFAELVRPGGPVTIDAAELRAIGLGQLKANLEHVQRRCQAEGWLGVRFPGGSAGVRRGRSVRCRSAD